MLLLAGAAGIALLALRPAPEPVYQGKRLSVWLHGYEGLNMINMDRRRETTEAVRNMGTNVIPFLLRRLRQTDSSFNNRLLQLLAKQHIVKISYTPARDLNLEAEEAFNALGARASNAVPELIRIYSGNISKDSQWTVAASLGSIGPAASNAVPLLLEHASAGPTSNTNNTFFSEAVQPVRRSAITALGRIHAQPATVVPVLAELLGESNLSIQTSAAIALGEFGSNAKPAVPAMIKFYNNETDNMAKAGTGATIKRIDPEAAAKAGIQ
jgi:hypothetical protein